MTDKTVLSQVYFKPAVTNIDNTSTVKRGDKNQPG